MSEINMKMMMHETAQGIVAGIKSTAADCRKDVTCKSIDAGYAIIINTNLDAGNMKQSPVGMRIVVSEPVTIEGLPSQDFPTIQIQGGQNFSPIRPVTETRSAHVAAAIQTAAAAMAKPLIL